ncbi:MAG: hypothetical protein GY930_06660, partial [bacterium]|nr:hypothetical protein [bacterium]
ADGLIASTGSRVGIGVTAPIARLDVGATSSGDTMGVRSQGLYGPTGGYLAVQGADDFDSITSADWYGLELGIAGVSTGSSNNDNYGVIGHSNGSGVRGEGIGVGVSGKSTYDGGVGVQGISNGTSAAGVGDLAVTGNKAFAMPNPLNPEREIRFLCMEGNESGTYFRGTAQLMDGVAHIPVPEDFALVTDGEGLTVQITLVGGWTESWVESSDLNSVVVRGNSDLTFHYTVSGMRRGYKDYDTDHANVSYRPEVRGIPFGAHYPAEQRQMMVESGMLNADFTPNEAFMKNVGWEMREPTDRELEWAANLATPEQR